MKNKLISIFTCILLAFIASSCGFRQYSMEMPSDKEFSVYRAVYAQIKYEETGLPTGQFPIVFGSLFKSKDRVVFGMCFIDGPSRWIVIDEIEWEKLNETSRKELIFHEMIHCDLGFDDHTDEHGLMHRTHQFLVNPDAHLRMFFSEMQTGLYNNYLTLGHSLVTESAPD